jgi:hypothetical protein
MIGLGYYLYMSIVEDILGIDTWLYGLIAGLIYLLVISLITILTRGWLAIVIPVRSIDPTKYMDIASDYRLFREHIGTYFWYISWYSLVLIALFLSYPIILILMTALDASLGWIFGVSGIIAILYILTRLYLSWYHMLSEGSGELKTFRNSLRLTRGRVWKVFWKVLVFSLVVTIVSSLVESLIIGASSVLGSHSIFDQSALVIEENKGNINQILSGLGKIL